MSHEVEILKTLMVECIFSLVLNLPSGQNRSTVGRRYMFSICNLYVIIGIQGNVVYEYVL